jgi:hypothetical protein
MRFYSLITRQKKINNSFQVIAKNRSNFETDLKYKNFLWKRIKFVSLLKWEKDN